MKINIYSNVFRIFVVVFFTVLSACVTTIPSGYRKLEGSDKTFLKSFNTTIENSCFHPKSAYFISRVWYANYEFLLEGKWHDNFSKLKLRVQDRVGNDYFHVSKINDKTSFIDMRRIRADDAQIRSLKKLIQILDAKFFRAFFCGDFIHESDLSMYYIKEDLVSKNSLQSYSLETEKDFSTFSLKISNNFSVSHSKDASVTIKSKGHCRSWLSKSCDFDMMWHGGLKKKKLIPSLIQVHFNEKEMRFKLLDFE